MWISLDFQESKGCPFLPASVCRPRRTQYRDPEAALTPLSLCFLCRRAKAMEASSLEKNLPDDNVGSGSILVGCSPLSWCGIVSLAGVIVVGDAFAYRFMWRFRWRERHRFSTSSSVLPFICDCFLQHAWKLKNFNTVGAKRLHCPDVCSSRVSKSTTVFPERHELTLVSKPDAWHSDSSRPRVLHKAMPWRIWQVQSASMRSCMEVDVPVRDRYHGVILTMEVAQIQLSTPRWTFLFGNRQVPWLFWQSPVEVPQIQLSTVWRTFLCSNRGRSRLASSANHPWTLRPGCVGVDRGVGSAS